MGFEYKKLLHGTDPNRQVLVYNDEKLDKILSQLSDLKILIKTELEELKKQRDEFTEKREEAYKIQDDFFNDNDLSIEENEAKFYELQSEYEYYNDRESCLDEYIDDLTELKDFLEEKY